MPMDAAAARRTRTILWTALLASQLVYVGMLASGVVPVGASEPHAQLPWVLAVVAAGQAAGAHFCWRKASGAGLPLHAARPGPEAVLPLYAIAWALDEGIGIYGLVLGFLGFAPALWAGFSAAGLVLLLLHRPARA